MSFKRTINWNKYETEVSTEGENQYLDFLIEPSFWGVNRLFVLLFESKGDRKVYKRYYLPNVEIKYCNVRIDGKSFFGQPVKNDMRTFQQVTEMIIQQVVC